MTKREQDVAALVAAVSNARFDDADKLLRSGADIDAKVDGMTSLHFVVQAKSIRGVRWLVKKGSSPDILDGNGLTPLMSACNIGGKKADQIALELIGADCNVKYRRSDGMSAIEFAAKHAAPSVLKALIDRGSDLNGPDNAELFPALLAVRSGNLENLKMLVQFGCDLRKTTSLSWAKGKTCLEVAQMEKQKAIVRYLEQLASS